MTLNVAFEPKDPTDNFNKNVRLLQLVVNRDGSVDPMIPDVLTHNYMTMGLSPMHHAVMRVDESTMDTDNQQGKYIGLGSRCIEEEVPTMYRDSVMTFMRQSDCEPVFLRAESNIPGRWPHYYYIPFGFEAIEKYKARYLP